MKKMRCVKDVNPNQILIFTEGAQYINQGDSTDFCITDNLGYLRKMTSRSPWGKCFKPIPDTSEPSPKYRLLKAITGRALMDDGACQDELGEFIKKYGYEDCATNYCVGTPNYCLAAYISQIKPKILLWLIYHGYLERIEPARTYHVGQRVKAIYGGNEYAIAPVGEKMVQLIATNFQSHYGKPAKIASFEGITQAEMDSMIDPNGYAIAPVGERAETKELPF